MPRKCQWYRPRRERSDHGKETLAEIGDDFEASAVTTANAQQNQFGWKATVFVGHGGYLGEAPTISLPAERLRVWRDGPPAVTLKRFVGEEAQKRPDDARHSFSISASAGLTLTRGPFIMPFKTSRIPNRPNLSKALWL
jgi:hypothetical protein